MDPYYVVIQDLKNGISNKARLYLKIDENRNYIWDVSPSFWEKEVAEANAKKYGGVAVYYRPSDLITGN
uniref:hypothetical protein n=1 Tax=Lactococcus garvieae TaxID=1363 RepID=UPI00359C624A